MATNLLLATVEWHENLARIHASTSDETAASIHTNAAVKMEADAKTALANRKPVIQQRAKPLLRHASRHRFLALQTASEANAEAQLTHELVAAQTRAVVEGKSPTLAAHKTFQRLLALKSAPMFAAIKKHPTAKLLGII